MKMEPDTGLDQATWVPPVAVPGSLAFAEAHGSNSIAAHRGNLPVYASIKLSGSVDPYLSSEPHHWRLKPPGSLEFQSPSSYSDTRLFATGVLEIFQDLSSYCQQWDSCPPSTSMGNAASTSFSVSEDELHTPDIGAVNGFNFIGSANDNINQLEDDFYPEVLDAFLNTAVDVDVMEDDQTKINVMEDDQTKINNVAGLYSPDHDLSLVEHEEVVGEYEELQDPLSCSVKCESVSDCASYVSGDEAVSEEPCSDSRLSVDMDQNSLQLYEHNEQSYFKDLPVFVPEQEASVKKPKLDLSLLLDSALPADNVIDTPEVLQLLCEADVNYSWLNLQDDSAVVSEVQPSVVVEQQLPEVPTTVLEEAKVNQVKATQTKSETTLKPKEKISRKRKGAVEHASAVSSTDVETSRASTKKARRTREEAELSRQQQTEEPRRSSQRPVQQRLSTVGKRPRSSTSVSTEEDICQKYRELRDRNNEASRRSRLNRKVQDEEMKKMAEHLEEENEKLRLKVEEMEKLRDKVKEALFRIVKGNGS